SQMSGDTEDATQIALQQIEANGSDLAKPLEMDFFVAVPSKAAGHKVAEAAGSLGFQASVENDPETGEWTCYCSKTLVPAVSEVVRIERQLNSIARNVGGYIDGFGTYGNKS